MATPPTTPTKKPTPGRSHIEKAKANSDDIEDEGDSDQDIL